MINTNLKDQSWSIKMDHNLRIECFLATNTNLNDRSWSIMRDHDDSNQTNWMFLAPNTNWIDWSWSINISPDGSQELNDFKQRIQIQKNDHDQSWWITKFE